MAHFPQEAQVSSLLFDSEYQLEKVDQNSKNAYTEYERKEMCTAETREKERKSKNKSTGNDYAIAASLAVKVVPYRTDPFSETP